MGGKMSSKRVLVPMKGSIKGRVFAALKATGDAGCSVSDLQMAAGDDVLSTTQVVQSSVHGIREMGFKIDYIDGRYFLKGRGISFTKYSNAGHAFPVCRKKSSKKKKASAKAILEAPKLAMIKAKTTTALGTGIFKIHEGALKKALDVLPEKPRNGLLKLSKKVQAYNSVVQRYLDMSRKMDETLEQLSQD